MSYTLISQTLSEWTLSNPILADDEIGYETDTEISRIGNGSDNFLSLFPWPPGVNGFLDGDFTYDPPSGSGATGNDGLDATDPINGIRYKIGAPIPGEILIIGIGAGGPWPSSPEILINFTGQNSVNAQNTITSIYNKIVAGHEVFLRLTNVTDLTNFAIFKRTPLTGGNDVLAPTLYAATWELETFNGVANTTDDYVLTWVFNGKEGSGGSVCSPGDLIEFTPVGFPFGGIIRSISDGVFFASDGSIVYRSYDNGLTWEQASDIGENIMAISRLNGITIASSSSPSNNAIYRSTDDFDTFSEVLMPNNYFNGINGITTGEGLFVFMSEAYDAIFYSPNAINWSESPFIWNSSTYAENGATVTYAGNDRFLIMNMFRNAAPFFGYFLTDSTFLNFTWVEADISFSNEFSVISTGVIITSLGTGSGEIIGSIDGGITFNEITFGNLTFGIDWTFWVNAGYDGTYYYIILNSPGTQYLYRSTDSINWEELAVYSPGILGLIISIDGNVTIQLSGESDGNILQILTDCPFVTSINGETGNVNGFVKQNGSTPFLAPQRGLPAIQSNELVTLSQLQPVCTPPSQWLPIEAAEANQWWSVAYGNGVWIAVARNGTNRVMRSTVDCLDPEFLEGYVKQDGSTPFTAPQQGVEGVAPNDLATVSQLGGGGGSEEELIIEPGYGLLYNWYAANDARGVAPSGFRIPSHADMLILQAEFVDETEASQALRSPRLSADGEPYWDALNGATNSSGFAAFAAGQRADSNGIYAYLREMLSLVTSDDVTNNYDWIIAGNFFNFGAFFNLRQRGVSIRCVSDIEPTTPTVQDNDGNLYTWVQIGAQYWLTQSLRTTTYNNGDPIITDLDDIAWSNTIEGAWAYPNGDSNLPLGNVTDPNAPVDLSGLVRDDGSIPFTAPQEGIEGVAPNHLVTVSQLPAGGSSPVLGWTRGVIFLRSGTGSSYAEGRYSSNDFPPVAFSAIPWAEDGNYAILLTFDHTLYEVLVTVHARDGHNEYPQVERLNEGEVRVSLPSPTVTRSYHVFVQYFPVGLEGL